MKVAFFSLLSIFIGYIWGYENAHRHIAKECERLGGFFVGKKVYQCTEITKNDL